MGCSYDPYPQTYYPTPADQWMEDNHFSKLSVASTKGGGLPMVYCHDCGMVIWGSKQGGNFLRLHIPRCLANPREEVPFKTEEELKTDEYKKVRYI